MLLTLAACGSVSASSGDAVSSAGMVPLAASATAKRPFTDIPDGAAYADAVAYCYEHGLMMGTASDTFDPDGSLTRAMTATVFYRMAGQPQVTEPLTFSDAKADTWYSSAVIWANSIGLMKGYGNQIFGINDPVSVEQLDVILQRYAGEDPVWQGDPDRTMPATRAQVATAVYSFANKAPAAPATAITTNGNVTIQLSDLAHYDANAESQVFYISDISSESLMAIYEKLNWTPGEKIAVKLSTGEPGSNYLRTDLIGGLVGSLTDPTIVECNTAYGGSRSNTAMHYQVAKDHGYTDIANVNIMDENGSMTLPVTGGTNLTENYVGANFANYDSFLVLSHFKGHAMAGFGGSIKNISIGIASSQGKSHIHSGGTGGSMWSGDQDAFLESMAEAGKSVVEALDGKIVYINVMNRLSVDCDCDGNPSAPDMHDIGILASYDPVALDQACVDLVYASDDGASLIRRMESRNGIHTLEHAEEIGLGNRSYNLVDIVQQQEVTSSMNMTVSDGTHTITFELNDSLAAQSLLEQLPLTLEVKPFSTNEQTFYPPAALDISGAPAITEAPVGTIAYYAPWKGIAIFYGELSGGGGGLYELGRAVSGTKYIGSLAGQITISRK